MRLHERLRRRLRRPIARLRGWRGNLDGETDSALLGWVQLAGGAIPRVGLYARGALLAQVPANVFRGDLAAAGINGGHAGFVLPLSPDTRTLTLACGGIAEVRVNGPRGILLGRWRPESGGRERSTAQPGTGALERRLYGDIQRLTWRLEEPPLPLQAPRPSSPVQARLFAAQKSEGGGLPSPMFAYAEHLRLRDGLEAQFDPTRAPRDLAPFFVYYLGVYGPARAPLRTPLSAAAIDWLNAPTGPDGISRATAMLLPRPDAPEARYRWAANRAWELHCEDCLVPADDITQLSSVRIDGPWPVTDFMASFAGETPELDALPLDSETGRRDLTCALMLLALSRPDLLRYIPTASLDAALADCVLAKFCASMGQPMPDLDRPGYAAALRRQGFELERMAFTCFTSEGHRSEFARLDPPSGEPVEIQIVGPFSRASGLGQATRLSAQVLETAGYRVHRADFTLDNPSPKDASRTSSPAFRTAPVTLLHLNAETLPLAAAYLPDVFSGSYTIAYPFWELDSPASCHALGLELVDELWVAPAFGVSVFQPHTDRPVCAVGMSYEALPPFPHDDARAFLQKVAQIKNGTFIFLASFDSYSFLKRKNPLGVVAAFTRAFHNQADVRLVLKTQNRARVSDPAQAELWRALDAAIERDPRIVLIDATLPYEDVLRIKAGADAYVSLHRAEGWGFGILEAMGLGTPVVATAYSGNMDFCSSDTCWLVDYSLAEVAPGDYIFTHPGQRWADPDISSAAAQFRAVYENASLRERRVAAAQIRAQREFSLQAIATRYSARLQQIQLHSGSGTTSHPETQDTA